MGLKWIQDSGLFLQRDQTNGVEAVVRSHLWKMSFMGRRKTRLTKYALKKKVLKTKTPTSMKLYGQWIGTSAEKPWGCPLCCLCTNESQILKIIGYPHQ